MSKIQYFILTKKLLTINPSKLVDYWKSLIKHTDEEEITAFIGLVYARRLFNLSHHSQKCLFLDGIGHQIFGETMSYKRFAFLNFNIRFDDTSTREVRFAHDRFTAISNFLKNSMISVALFYSLMNTWRLMKHCMVVEIKYRLKNKTALNLKYMDTFWIC